MRLRYLHLPRFGPLTDASIVFGREDLIFQTLDVPRQGALNFIVGVNGSGKSSLLRALYRIFRSLNRREWPALPFTLAWDRTVGEETVSALLHTVGGKNDISFFATCRPITFAARRQDWEEIIHAVRLDAPHPLFEKREIITGSEAITSPLLYARLPKRMIAYTSGDSIPWLQIDHPEFHPPDYEEGQYQTEDERPQGWSMEQEWEEVQHIRNINIPTGKIKADFATGANVHFLSKSSRQEGLSTLLAAQLQQDPERLQEVYEKLLSNRMLLKEPLDEAYFRMETQHLRYAGITLALRQAAKELGDLNEENQRETLRKKIILENKFRIAAKDARRVLNQVDWFWPTHLSLTYYDENDRVTPQQHQELLCLVALADEVISQPLGRYRAIFSLGPSDRISLTEKLQDAFPLGSPSKEIEHIAQRVDNSKTMAEAILRILSTDENIDSTLLDVFNRLRDWERTGLLEDITLTIKRLHQAESTDGEPDDIIITYDQLSDGEQMFLGRMGLLFLLRGQDGSLLLLDEPETHFNDVWKREIVDMVDLSVLKSTKVNVIISTHTSIALTDAFAAEVTVLDKTDEGITARSVAGGLFGTDPGEVNMNLFRADSSIGRRSEELLAKLLKTEWKGREDELAEILDILGSSFHRAELRAILKRLREQPDGPASR